MPSKIGQNSTFPLSICHKKAIRIVLSGLYQEQIAIGSSEMVILENRWYVALSD